MLIATGNNAGRISSGGSTSFQWWQWEVLRHQLDLRVAEEIPTTLERYFTRTMSGASS
jgi:hypothetical protein